MHSTAHALHYFSTVIIWLPFKWYSKWELRTKPTVQMSIVEYLKSSSTKASSQIRFLKKQTKNRSRRGWQTDATFKQMAPLFDSKGSFTLNLGSSPFSHYHQYPTISSHNSHFHVDWCITESTLYLLMHLNCKYFIILIQWLSGALIISQSY